jgi:ribosomal protein S18 acetylase RimI-like enzyme
MNLRPMTAAEFEAFRDEAVVGYAGDKVRAGIWTLEVAAQKSGTEFDELLPDGLATKSMLLFTAEDEFGQPVGALWLCLRRGDVLGTGWIYDISIVADQRGRGLGRELLAAGEREFARHGVTTVGLNVFGDNPVARHLYESAGYRVTAQQMSKAL